MHLRCRSSRIDLRRRCFKIRHDVFIDCLHLFVRVLLRFFSTVTVTDMLLLVFSSLRQNNYGTALQQNLTVVVDYRQPRPQPTCHSIVTAVTYQPYVTTVAIVIIMCCAHTRLLFSLITNRNAMWLIIWMFFCFFHHCVSVSAFSAADRTQIYVHPSSEPEMTPLFLC